MSARRLREIVLTIGAVLGVACVLVAVAAAFFDVRLVVFRSGSMAPVVETGGVAVTRAVDATDVKIGDIVSVPNEQGVRITHRVMLTTAAADGAVELKLKGDDNPRPDVDTYTVTEADLVVAHANRLGYVVNALASPYAMFVGGMAAAGLLWLGFRRRETEASTDQAEQRETVDA